MSTTVEITVKSFDKAKHTVRIKMPGSKGIVLTPDKPSATVTLADALVTLSEFAPLADLETEKE